MFYEDWRMEFKGELQNGTTSQKTMIKNKKETTFTVKCTSIKRSEKSKRICPKYTYLVIKDMGV